jgi:hypothetical protein
MTDDIVYRLRTWDDQQPPFRTMNEAADEIERLRRVVHTIAGYISTLDEYKTIHPEAVYQFFYDKA